MMIQKGFTLVELAIVLMIIGLLIGGILKGQELIQNARIITIGRNVRSYDAAVTTFMDSYGARPGDISNPSTRLPNCSASPCSNAGNGDGLIGANVVVGDENNMFWFHLNAANLISGFDSSIAPSTGGVDMNYPAEPIKGFYYVVVFNQAPSPSNYINGLKGHYLRLTVKNSAGTGLTSSLPVLACAQIDRKFDDGKPWTGDVIRASSTGMVTTGNGVAGNEYALDSTFLCSPAFSMAF